MAKTALMFIYAIKQNNTANSRIKSIILSYNRGLQFTTQDVQISFYIFWLCPMAGCKTTKNLSRNAAADGSYSAAEGSDTTGDAMKYKSWFQKKIFLSLNAIVKLGGG